MKKLLLIGALVLLMAPGANASLVQSYIVFISGGVATQTLGPGFISGTGTASLDSSGVLSMTSAQNIFLPGLPVNVSLTGNQSISGTLGGASPLDTLSGATGTDTITSCSDDFGNFVCGTYINPTIGIPNPFGAVTNPIAFDNNAGGTTVFQTTESLIAGSAIATTTWTLTAVPEPGTLLLIGSGVIGLGAFGRKRAA